MEKKGSKARKGVKKAGAKKTTGRARVSAKVKKAPAKKKKVAKVTGRKEVKTAKKIVKKVVKKVKAEKKKPVKKALKKEIKKVKAKVKKKVEKVVKPKKVVAKKEKKAPLKPEKKVRAKKIAIKPEVKVKKVAPPRKVVPRKPKEVLPPVAEEKYPPLPVEILPEEYGENSITLMTVDPKGLFTYWEVREDTVAQYEGNLAIRVYDVTGVDFDGTNAHSFSDIPVTQRIGSWYIDVSPEREYIVDIGMIDPLGKFVMVARSNKVSTPMEGVAEEGVLPQKLLDTGLPIGY